MRSDRPALLKSTISWMNSARWMGRAIETIHRTASKDLTKDGWVQARNKWRTLLAAVFSIGAVVIASAEPASLRYYPPSERSIFEAIDSVSPAGQQAILKHAAQEVLPVYVFIPGISGSKLTKIKDGKEIIIWGKFDWLDLIKDNPDLAYDKKDSISATPLDTFYAPLNNDIDVYGHAFSQLKAITGVPGNVLRFAYDWRQSNIASAQDFSKWLCSPQVFETIKGHPVVFIAHSMGGLILKYWLEHSYSQPSCGGNDVFANWLKVSRVILVGTPNFGAPKAILSFSEGTALYVDSQRHLACSFKTSRHADDFARLK